MIEFVGYQVGRDPRTTGLIGGPGSGVPGGATAADGDYILYWMFYPNTMTLTWATGASTGWTLLRKKVGTLGTVELWWRQWHTGDPSSWHLDQTGYNAPDRDASIEFWFKGLAGPPTVVSAAHETTASPAIADSVSDGSITTADWALCCFASKTGDLIYPSGDTTPPLDTAFSADADPSVLMGWRIPGTAGTSAAVTALATGVGGSGDLFGLQVILPDVPLGGWGVGMVRMGAN